MDLATIIGLVMGIATIAIVLILDGGSPAELFAVPQAIMLIVFGSLAATIITVPLKAVIAMPKYLMQAFTVNKFELNESIEILVQLADKARKEGLLALEEDTKKVTDKFLRDALMMVVDGIDPGQIRAILETNIEQVETRHGVGIGFFAAAGGFAPTFGIIGTVMGLISVLKQLDDPSKLAGSIASAFLATLWGLVMSNLIYLPISGKLKAKNAEEIHVRTMQMEGVLAIQAGENPRIVKEKLSAYLPPSMVKAAGEDGEEKPKKGQAPNAQKAKA
jgi:chemotaxis protein MotA